MAKRRKSGEGTVRQRKDGRWEGRVVVGYDENGLLKTKNVLAKTKTECVEKLEALKETIGNPMPSKCISDMSFGDWMDFWYQNYSKISLRPSTQAGYENHIYKHIIPSLGRIPLNKLTQNDLQVFYANLKKTVGSIERKSTVKAYPTGVCERVTDAAGLRWIRLWRKN